MTLKELHRKLEKLVDDAVDEVLMKKIVDKTSESVKTRTKRGFGVNADGGKSVRLKGISESTKKRRKRLRKQGQLSSDTSPRKSNLTSSGEMLNNITGRVDSKTEGTIFLKGKRNKEIAQRQSDDNRKFMNLNKTEIKDIKDIIETKLINDINKKGL